MKKKSAPGTSANRNFRARILYKSGSSHDFLIVASSTTIFETLRTAFQHHLNDATAPAYGLYTVGESGALMIRWTDVSSVHTWVD